MIRKISLKKLFAQQGKMGKKKKTEKHLPICLILSSANKDSNTFIKLLNNYSLLLQKQVSCNYGRFAAERFRRGEAG
jgi:hypothetical protein